MTTTIFEQMTARYTSGEPIPWGDTLPPPEVVALLDKRLPSRALDLGCGFGRASIYMAQRGWVVDGVDFVAEAIEEAQRRAASAGVTPAFYRGDVTKLDFLSGGYDFAVDVGCAHVLKSAELIRYIAELTRLLTLGADYLLYARLQEPATTQESGSTRGLDEQMLLDLFDPTFKLVEISYGERRDFHAPWKSAWLHFMRRDKAVGS